MTGIWKLILTCTIVLLGIAMTINYQCQLRFVNPFTISKHVQSSPPWSHNRILKTAQSSQDLRLIA